MGWTSLTQRLGHLKAVNFNLSQGRRASLLTPVSDNDPLRVSCHHEHDPILCRVPWDLLEEQASLRLCRICNRSSVHICTERTWVHPT
jgi:hypothetical protein